MSPAFKTVKLKPARNPFRIPFEKQHTPLLVVSGILAIIAPLPGRGERIVALRFAGEKVLPATWVEGLAVRALIPSQVKLDPETRDYRMVRVERIAHAWTARLHLSADERLANFICEFAVRCGDTERVMLPTQQQMADITAQTSVNVNRVMAQLTRDGYFKRNGREVIFTDFEGLAQLGLFQREIYE
jgi:hypothetical protein